MHPINAVILVFTVWAISLLLYSYRSFAVAYTARTHKPAPGFMTWFSRQFVNRRKFAKQHGGIDIGGIMMLGISMVFLAIGFIFLPITTTAASTLLAWSYSANGTITDATFTGFTSVVGITPLLILVGFLTAAVVAGMMGIKVVKGGASASGDPGSLILLGLSIVFIGIGLIIEPVVLDGVASIISGTDLTAFTGYQSILLVSPMLVHLGFIAAAVLSGFFGLKKLGGGMS